MKRDAVPRRFESRESIPFFVSLTRFLLFHAFGLDVRQGLQSMLPDKRGIVLLQVRRT